MKKLIDIKTIILAAMGVTLMLCGTSCLNAEDPSEEYSNSPALISFQYSGFSAAPFTAGIVGTPSDSFPIEVTLSVKSIVLNNAVSATIAPDQNSLDSFNAANGTSYVQLASSLYTLPDNGTVTINPGQQIVNFTVRFAGDQIDFNASNALALKIVDANGAVVASNLSVAILLIQLKSIYEGNYLEEGVLTRYNGPTESSGVLDEFPITGSAYFSTISTNSIDGEIVIPGFVQTKTLLTVNSDNTVTIGPSPSLPSTAMQNIPGTTSTYDPATKTFDLHGEFLNSSGNLRRFDYTMSMQ